MHICIHTSNHSIIPSVFCLFILTTSVIHLNKNPYLKSWCRSLSGALRLRVYGCVLFSGVSCLFQTSFQRGNQDSLLETSREAVTIVPKCTLSWAQQMWQQWHSLSVCIWLQDCANLRLESTVRVLPHPHRSPNNCFSISVQFFPQVAPHFFGQHDSPSNLASVPVPSLQLSSSCCVKRKYSNHSDFFALRHQ